MKDLSFLAGTLLFGTIYKSSSSSQERDALVTRQRDDSPPPTSLGLPSDGVPGPLYKQVCPSCAPHFLLKPQECPVGKPELGLFPKCDAMCPYLTSARALLRTSGHKS